MNFAARGANGALLLVLCLRLDVVVSSEATCTAAALSRSDRSLS